MIMKRIEIMVLITSILQTVDVQMMFPAPQPMFMMPPPPPVGVPVPFPVPMPVIVTQKTTTTTTKAPKKNENENDGNNNNNGIMFIGGNPFAPPLIVMPMPQSNVRKVEYEDESSSREDSSSDDASDSSDSSRSSYMLRKRGKRRRVRVKGHKRHHLRVAHHGQKHSENHRKTVRSKRNSRLGDPGFVKPVLTYLSHRGNVKFKKRISGDDAARLMGKKEMHSDDEKSSDSIQIRSPKEISGLRLLESTERTRGIGTLPDRRVSNISVSYRLY